MRGQWQRKTGADSGEGYQADSEEEEIRDEQGRILHSYLSKEELAAMQEALAEENTVKLDTKEIINLKEVNSIMPRNDVLFL